MTKPQLEELCKTLWGICILADLEAGTPKTRAALQAADKQLRDAGMFPRKMVWPEEAAE